MSDQPPTPPGPPASPAGGGGFCGECGAALDPGAVFCGSCGAATFAATAAAGGGPAGGPSDPTAPGGASTWTGVQPVVERPTDVTPPVPPPPGGPTPPAGPPPGPTTAPGKGKGPLIAVVLLVLAALAAGAFFVLGGDDDEVASDDTTTTEADDTTTTEPDDTTTTTEADDTTTTAPAGDALAGFNFVQVQDDTGVLVVEVPDTWQVDGRSLENGLPNVQAAQDLAAFTSFGSSGISFTRLGTGADPDATIDFLIGANNLDAGCTTADERVDYDDGVFVGRAQRFSGCSGSGATVFEIVGNRSDGVGVEVTVAIVSPDPEELIEQIIRTFNLTQ